MSVLIPVALTFVALFSVLASLVLGGYLLAVIISEWRR